MYGKGKSYAFGTYEARAVVKAVAATVVMGTVVLAVMVMMAPASLVLVRIGVVVMAVAAAEAAMPTVPVQKEPAGQQAALPALSTEQKESVLQHTAVVTIVEQ